MENNRMKTITKYGLLILLFCSVSSAVMAQATVYPAASQQKPVAITGAMIHIGNGEAIAEGTVVFENGKITYVGTGREIPAGADVIDGSGKHLYPGFIAPNTNLGLVEVTAVRATVDFAEVGDNNAHVRALVAYNTESKVINTLRSNGVLLAQVTPQGGLISGQSSIVQLDAWNWEDAAYKIDEGLHVNWPTMRFGRFGGGGDAASSLNAQKERISQEVAALETYFSEAKAYADLAGKQGKLNSRFEALRPIFSGERKVYVHANRAVDIIAAVTALKRHGIRPVLVGGTEAHLVTQLLVDNQVPVIINQSHALPYSIDADVYLPYKQAKLLSDAGVKVAYSINGFWQQRNLPFMAGTAAAYGLDKELALATITGNAAEILGIADKTGTLEVGKDANLFISSGDALDMLGNDVERAFIQGRDIDLDNLHKQLRDRYEYRYEQRDAK